MNISQLINANTSNSLAGAKTPTQATSSASPVSNAMTKADSRIQSQLDTTTTQLSLFGKLKSSVSDAQLASRALSGLTATASAAEIKASVNRFVAAFNATIATAKSTATVAGGTLAESSNAGRVSRDMSRSVTTNASLNDSFKTLGLKQLADGSLSLDSVKFDAAQKTASASVQSTLSKIGQLVDKVATQELATGGLVNSSVASLNQRSANLKTQQNAMLTMVQKFSNAQSPVTSGYAGYGLAAYKSNS